MPIFGIGSKVSISVCLSKNIKLTLSYDGNYFTGSQTQPHAHTVQDALQDALHKLGIDTKIIFSGRTDKGVHATNQVANCSIPSHFFDLEKFRQLLNFQLSPSAYIKRISFVDDAFHSRFSAKKRVYRYMCKDARYFSPFEANYFHFVENLNPQAIKQAASVFCGTYDFRLFCKTGSSPKSTVRTVYRVDVYTKKNVCVIRIEGNAFLRSQVRMMVGFLLQIAQGKYTTDDLLEQLGGIRQISTKIAPASGLYLTQIKY